MHSYRTVLAIAAGLGVVCTFLPWVEAPFPVERPGVAWLTLLLCGGVLAISLVGDRRTPLVSGARTASIIGGGVVGAIALWQMFDIRQATDVALAFGVGSISVGIGVYLLIVVGAVTAALPLIIKDVAAPAMSQVAAQPTGPQCSSCGAPLMSPNTSDLCPPCQRGAT